MSTHLRDPAPHQQTLREWLRQGDGDTILLAPKPAYGDLWRMVGRYTPAAVASAWRDASWTPVDTRDGMQWHQCRHGVLATREGDDRPVGAFLRGTLWVSPEARREGVGAGLLLANTRAGLEMGAASYAVNGFRSRLSPCTG